MADLWLASDVLRLIHDYLDAPRDANQFRLVNRACHRSAPLKGLVRLAHHHLHHHHWPTLGGVVFDLVAHPHPNDDAGPFASATQWQWQWPPGEKTLVLRGNPARWPDVLRWVADHDNGAFGAAFHTLVLDMPWDHRGPPVPADTWNALAHLMERHPTTLTGLVLRNLPALEAPADPTALRAVFSCLFFGPWARLALFDEYGEAAGVFHFMLLFWSCVGWSELPEPSGARSGTLRLFEMDLHVDDHDRWVVANLFPHLPLQSVRAAVRQFWCYVMYCATNLNLWLRSSGGDADVFGMDWCPLGIWFTRSAQRGHVRLHFCAYDPDDVPESSYGILRVLFVGFESIEIVLAPRAWNDDQHHVLRIHDVLEAMPIPLRKAMKVVVPWPHPDARPRWPAANRKTPLRRWYVGHPEEEGASSGGGGDEVRTYLHPALLSRKQWRYSEL